MQRVLVAILVCSACLDAPLPAASVPPVEVPVAATSPEAATPDEHRDGPRFKLTLRSTPPGAEASVDGHPVGAAPVVAEVRADGRAHEITFVLSGYLPWRVKFPPKRDGVVHAALKPRMAPR